MIGKLFIESENSDEYLKNNDKENDDKSAMLADPKSGSEIQRFFQQEKLLHLITVFKKKYDSEYCSFHLTNKNCSFTFLPFFSQNFFSISSKNWKFI